MWFLRRIQKKMALPTVSRDLVAALISLFCSDDLRSLPSDAPRTCSHLQFRTVLISLTRCNSILVRLLTSCPMLD